MVGVVEKIKSLDYFYSTGAVKEREISDLEKAMDLSFSEEYKNYLLAFGCASFKGYELTGICPFPRLNVCNVTKEERINNPLVPRDWYVVEQLNIEGVVIWQSSTGEIYQTAPNIEPKKICDSLAEYIEM